MNSSNKEQRMLDDKYSADKYNGFRMSSTYGSDQQNENKYSTKGSSNTKDHARNEDFQPISKESNVHNAEETSLTYTKNSQIKNTIQELKIKEIKKPNHFISYSEINVSIDPINVSPWEDNLIHKENLIQQNKESSYTSPLLQQSVLSSRYSKSSSEQHKDTPLKNFNNFSSTQKIRRSRSRSRDLIKNSSIDQYQQFEIPQIQKPDQISGVQNHEHIYYHSANSSQQQFQNQNYEIPNLSKKGSPVLLSQLNCLEDAIEYKNQELKKLMVLTAATISSPEKSKKHQHSQNTFTESETFSPSKENELEEVIAELEKKNTELQNQLSHSGTIIKQKDRDLNQIKDQIEQIESNTHKEHQFLKINKDLEIKLKEKELTEHNILAQLEQQSLIIRNLKIDEKQRLKHTDISFHQDFTQRTAKSEQSYKNYSPQKNIKQEQSIKNQEMINNATLFDNLENDLQLFQEIQQKAEKYEQFMIKVRAYDEFSKKNANKEEFYNKVHEYDELNKKYKQFQELQDHITLLEKLQRKTEENQDIINKNKQSEELIEKLQRQISELQQTISIMNEEKKKTNLNNSLKDLPEIQNILVVQEQERKIKDQSIEIANLNDQMNIQSQLIEKQIKKINNQNKNINDQIQKNQALKKKVIFQQQDNTGHNFNLINESKCVKSDRKQEVLDECNFLIIKRQQLSQEISTANNELNKLKQEFQFELNAFEETLSALKMEIDTRIPYSNKYELNNIEKRNGKQNIGKISTIAQNSSVINIILEDDLTDVELGNIKKYIQLNMDEYEQLLQGLPSSNSNREYENFDLLQKLNAFQEQKQQIYYLLGQETLLKELIQEYQEKNKGIQSKNEQIDKKVKDYEFQLKIIQQQNSSLRDENEELQQQVKMLEQESIDLLDFQKCASV